MYCLGILKILENVRYKGAQWWHFSYEACIRGARISHDIALRGHFKILIKLCRYCWSWFCTLWFRVFVRCQVTADNCSFNTVSKTCDYLITERNFEITQFGVGFVLMNLFFFPTRTNRTSLQIVTKLQSFMPSDKFKTQKPHIAHQTEHKGFSQWSNQNRWRLWHPRKKTKVQTDTTEYTTKTQFDLLQAERAATARRPAVSVFLSSKLLNHSNLICVVKFCKTFFFVCVHLSSCFWSIL